MKRTPLKRRGWPTGKSARRLSPKSDKRLAYEAEINALRPDLEMRCKGLCEAGPEPRCHGVVVPHHRKRRSQGGPNTLDNLLMVCDYHHTLIHLNPGWSLARGFLLHAYDEITPIQEVVHDHV